MLCQSSELYRAAEEGLRNERRLERYAQRLEAYLRRQLEAAGFLTDQPQKELRRGRRR